MDDFERQAAPERTPEGLTPVLAPLGVATGGVASGVVDRANGLTTAHLVQGGNGAFTRWLDQRGQANDPVLQPVTVDPITMRPVAFEADEQTADAWPSLGTVEISATRWGPLDEVVSAVLEHVATALSPGVERERAEARAKVAIAEILRA